MRGYQQAAQFGNPKFLDHFLDSEQGDQIRQDLKLKRIQFDTTPNWPTSWKTFATSWNAQSVSFWRWS